MIKFKKHLTSSGVALFRNNDFNIYLYFRDIVDAPELEISDAENLFSLLLANGSGSVLILSNRSGWSPDGIANYLRSLATTSVKATFSWCSDKDNPEFVLGIGRAGNGYRYFIEQQLIPGGLTLMPRNATANVILTKGSFVVGLQNVVLYDIDDEDSTSCENVSVNLTPSQKAGEFSQVFSFEVNVKNGFFNGGMGYHFMKDESSVGHAYSEILSEEYRYQFKLDPFVNSNINPRNIHVTTLADNLQNHFVTSSKKFSLRPSGDFKFIRSSKITGQHDRKTMFLPEGELEVSFDDNDEHTLLLNSGATGIAIRNGDKLVFNVNREQIFDEHGIAPSEIDVPYISIRSAKENKLHISSQNKVYYSGDGQPFLPGVGNVTQVQFPILPVLNYENHLFEEKYLEKVRHAKLALPFRAQKFHALLQNAPTVVVTSKGIQAKFVASADSASARLAGYTFTAADSKTQKFSLEVDSPQMERLIDGIEKDDSFVVIPPSFLQSLKSYGNFKLSGWEFDFFNDPVEPLIVFKYNNESFEECFSEGGVQHWSNRHIGNIESSDPDEQEFMRERWRQRCETIVAKALKGEHQKNFTNPSWKGVKVFSIPISPNFVPEILRPFVPETGLYADYVGFGSASPENRSVSIHDPKCFAAINYKSLDDRLQDQPKSEEEPESANFAFKLLELNALFTDSKIQSMDCLIKIGVKQVLQEKITGETENGYHVIKLRGSYNASSDTYVFKIETKLTLNFTNSIFREITFSGATLSYDAGEKRTKLDLSGGIVMNPNLKFGEYSFKDFMPESGEFFDLGFNFGKSLLPDFARTKFSLKFPEGTDSIFGSFPLKFNSFQFKTATSLNLFNIIGADFSKSIGFLFDINLGTLGGLSFLKKFSAQIYVGWSFGDDNNENKALHFGFRLTDFPNSFSTSINFNLFDTIGISINRLMLCRYKSDGKTYFFLKLEDCKFNLFSKEFKTLNGAIFMDSAKAKDLAWILLYKPDSTDEGVSKYLRYLALGQRTGINPDQQLPEGAYVEDIIKIMEKNLKDLECPDTDDENNTNPNVFNPEIEWLIGAHISFEDFFDLKFVFMDPQLYAMRLKVIELFTFDALYYKVNEGTGAWRAKLELEPELRNWSYGVVDFTLPNIEVEAVTNGDFKFDLGFPTVGRYTTDYTDSAVAQVYIFIGKGGMYIGKSKLNAELCNNEPGTKTLLFGNAMRVGIGREIKKGPFAAGATITFYGIYEGAGCFRNDKYVPHNFELRGRAGVILEIEGRVNFRIVSASVHLWIEIFSSILLAKNKAIRIKAGGNVVATAKIRIKVGFVKITKKFSFKTRIEYEFLIGKDKQKSMLIAPEPVAYFAETINAVPAVLTFTYVPQFSVHEGVDKKGILKVYHTIGLLSYSAKDENEVVTYADIITLSKGTVEGNPLKKILHKFREIELQVGGPIDKGFDFVPYFSFRFLPMVEADYQNKDGKLSRIQIPLIEGIRINDDVIRSENIDNSYITLIDQWFDEFFTEYRRREKPNAFLLDEPDPLARQLQNDFFEFIYQEAKRIHGDLGTFTDNQYDELEGVITYFFESGLRLPDPRNVSRSVPWLATFNHSSQILNTTAGDRYVVTYANPEGDQSSDHSISPGDKHTILSEFNAGYKERWSALQKVTVEHSLFSRALEIPVNSSTKFILGANTYYQFPEMMRLKNCKLELFRENAAGGENESVLSDQLMGREVSANIYAATLVEIFGQQLETTDSVIYELKGASSINSKYLRLLDKSAPTANPLSLKFIREGKIISSETSELAIYKRNLSNVPRPSIEVESLAVDQLQSYYASYSKDPALFIKILLDATLTNSGGYYFEIKASRRATESFFAEAENRKLETLGFLFEERNVSSRKIKLSHQNIFRTELSADNLVDDKEEVLFFREVYIDNKLLEEHVATVPPNAIKVKLSLLDPEAFHELDASVEYVLKEEFNKLEIALECDGVKIIEAEKALSLLPQFPKENQLSKELTYQHIAPIQKKGLNRYTNVGKECKITLNWRNSMGERLFALPWQTVHTHSYSDVLVPINEWPDATYGFQSSARGVEFHCSIGYREKVLNELAKEHPELLGSAVPAGVVLQNDGKYYTAGKTFSISPTLKLQVDNELKHYFRGSFALREGDQHGDYDGVLGKLQEIRDQIEDIHIRNSKLIRLELNGAGKNGTAKQTLPIGQDLYDLIKQYCQTIEQATTYFDASQASVKKFYTKVEVGGEIRYEFSHLENEVPLTVAQRSFRVSVPNEFFNTLLGSDSICKLSAALILERSVHLADNNFTSQLASVSKVSTSLTFHPNVLKHLEAKLKGISFGTGFDSAEGRIASWMINVAKVLTPVSKLKQEKSESARVDYLLKPVSTNLWGGNFVVNPGADKPEIESFSKVDLDVALREILTAVEKYIEPRYFSLYQEDVGNLLEVKARLSEFLSARFVHKYVLGSRTTNAADPAQHGDIIKAVKEYLLEDLNNFYRMEGITVHQGNKPADHEVDSDFRLYTVGPFWPEHSPDQEFNIRSGKIEHYQLASLVDYKKNNLPKENDQMSFIEAQNLQLSITHIEHNIEEFDDTRPEQSDWITLLTPFKSNYEFSGFTTYNRKFPQSPRAVLHATSPKNSNAEPSEVLGGAWDYYMIFEYEATRGDKLTITLTYNEPAPTIQGLLAEEQLDFAALAYLQRLLRRGDILDLGKIQAINSIPLIRLKANALLDAQASLNEVRTFTYNGTEWSTAGDWSITLLSNGNWRIASSRPFSIFGDTAKNRVNASMHIKQNEDLGEHFLMRTDEVFFTGSVIPKLDYVHIVHKDGSNIREMNGANLLKEALKKSWRRVIVEEMIYQRNGVKHLISPVKMVTIDSDTRPAPTYNFAAGRYYKISIFDLTLENGSVLLMETNFLHSISHQ